MRLAEHTVERDELESRIEYNSANCSLCWKENWEEARSLDAGE
jgi:hypothetical protein